MTAAATEWSRPGRVAAGDRIALIAPASPCPRDEIDRGVAELARLGFEAVYDDRALARERFVAGGAALRAAAIHDAWRDASIAAVMAIRGGWGSAELLPWLDVALMRRARKAFIGYSDITTLLSLHLQHGLVCFHGLMVDGRLAEGGDRYDRVSFLHAVGRAEPLGLLAPPGLGVLRHGDAQGVLVGGTLTQVCASLGTPWAFTVPDRGLLFLEDVGERPYRVVRMLTQLAQAGIFARARGVVFGEMRSCDEPAGGHPIRDVLAEFFHDFPGPVLFGFPSGHTTGPTWTLPFGVRARMSTVPPALDIEEPAVADRS